MKVSVCVRTYNHEPFVEQAVGGALAQATDFDFEVVVGDDASSDRTQEILRRLGDSHPERLRLFLREANIGSKNNLIDVYGACRGDYVAFLDGDDHWITSDKLQRQADYLDQHPEVSICGTGWKTDRRVRQAPRQTSATMADFLRGGNQLSSGLELLQSTIMLRKSCLPALPEWIHKTYLVDLVVQYLCLKQGNMACLDGITTYYRQHGAARFSQLTPDKMIKWDIATWQEILKDSDPSCARPIKRRLAAAYFRLADVHKSAGREEESKAAYGQAKHLGTLADWLRHLVRSRFPGPYRSLLKLKARLRV